MNTFTFPGDNEITFGQEVSVYLETTSTVHI